ncbi:MAG: CoA-binding protein [Candidatus Bathyarchaeota archaeon]|nr:CoA-binding protein [Candidatus Bathyarchaeota archaeon]
MRNRGYSEILLQMKRIMEPRSVAIVGASGKIEKVGGAVTRNALESDYLGKIYLVNPNTTQIFGRKVYPSLEEVPGEVDLAEIVVPAPIVPTVMEEAARKGVKGAVIVSAGFAEVGKTSLQAQVVRAAEAGGIRVIGPNCFGIINTEIGLDLSFTFSKALKGSIAFVSQSGAMCCGTLDWAYKEEIGFSKFINLGNKCDVDESDSLVYLMEDQQTRIIAMYVEGVTDGRRLFETMKLVSRRKPIVVLKAGITEPGARAALSHTASIAGSAEIVKAALKQSGAVVVDDIEELFDAAQVLSQPQAAGKNVAVLSNAGGLGVITTDWCHRLGLKVPQLPAQTREELKSFLLPIASTYNPIDVTGSAEYDCYKRVLDVVSKLEIIDLIIPIFVSQGLTTSDGPARAVVEEWRKSGKPMLAFWMGGNSVMDGVKILRRGGIPVYSSPARVAKAATALVTYSEYRKKITASETV